MTPYIGIGKLLPFCSLTHKWYLVYLFPFQRRGRLRARALSDETGGLRYGLGNCLWALSLRKPVAASCMATAIGSSLRAFVRGDQQGMHPMLISGRRIVKLKEAG